MIKNLLLFLSLFLGSIFYSSAQQHRFSPSKWSILDDNKCDGSIDIELIRHWGGHTWGNEKNLYLQFKNSSNKWEDILYIKHFFDNGNKYLVYSAGSYYFTQANRNPSMGYDYYAYTFNIKNGPNPNKRTSYRWIQKDNNDYISDTKQATSFKPAAVNLSVENDIDCNTVKLKWNKPHNTDGFIKYWIQRKRSDSSYWPYRYKIVNNTLEYTDTQANGNTSYDYRVRSINSCNNESEYSNEIQGHGILSFDKPLELKAEPLCDNKIHISWKRPMKYPNKYELLYRKNSSDEGSEEIEGEKYNIINIENGESFEYEFQADSPFNDYSFFLRNKNKCNVASSLSNKAISQGHNLLDAPEEFIGIQDEGENAYTFSWKDISYETAYFITRVNLEDSNDKTTFDIDKDETSYTDKTANFCTSYRYTLYSKNECGSTKGESLILTVKPDLSGYFEDLEISKGYYSERVELNWKVSSNRKISEVKIYRSRKDEDNKQLVASLESRQKSWTDEKTEANILYEYTLEGVQFCGEENAITNTLIGTGFRMPFGKVYGQISFEGGNPVVDAEIIAEASSEDTYIGKSINFNGKDFLQIKNSDSFNSISELCIMMWVKPDQAGQGNFRTLIDKINEETKTGFSISHNKESNKILVKIGTGTSIIEQITDIILDSDSFTNIALSIMDNTAKLYINGIEKQSSAINGAILSSSKDIFIGSTSEGIGFEGLIDEVSIFSKGKNAKEILQNYNRKLSASDKDLLVYLQMDEGVGNYAYDSSKTNSKFNKNHAAFNSCTWSDMSPSSSQLSYKGISDQNGNYTIDFIKYKGRGDIFNITPIKGIHKFSPNLKRQFIGKGSEYSSIDFADISSFRFTGSVKYTLDNSNYPAKGIRLLIDGKIVSKLGKIIETDANGEFDIQVPIGKHVVSVEKTGHHFAESSYPKEGLHDFRENISGVEFLDSSYVKVAGRVIGGKIQGDKIIGFGESVNNIGVATISFQSESDERYKKSVTTDINTGEYEIKLLPINILVTDLSIDNPDIVFKSELYADILKLDKELIEKNEVKIEYADKNKTEVKSTETYKYNLKKNFIYRANPSIGIFDQQGHEFAGEKSIEILVNAQTQKTVTVDISEQNLGFPILFSNNIYKLKIKAFEQYTNPHTSIVDRVAVTDGLISIVNNLGDSKDIENIGDTEKIELNNKNGEVDYVFESNKPNLLSNNINPEFSFTSTLKINLQAGGNTSEWKPNEKYFRAYLIGSKTKGQNFVTTGPQTVKWILHDPPGSNSYTYIESGSTLTKSTTVSFHEDIVNQTSVLVKTGPKIVIGGGLLGPQIETEVVSDLAINFNVEQAAGRNDIDITEISFSKNISTSADANLVGTPSDLFIGYANNIIYGEAEAFGLLPVSQIEEQGLESIGETLSIEGKDYKLAKSPSFFVNTNGFNTMFIYTFDHIENSIIPNLILLRNNLFTKENSLYISHLDIENPNYASNNDNKVWGDLASSKDNKVTTEEDFDGQSYTYKHKENPKETDSVRWYNQQIRLWTESLIRCEKEKIETTKYFEENTSNISFVGGGQALEASKTITSTNEVEEYWDLAIESGFAANFGVKINNVGVATTNTLGVKLGGGGTYTEANTTENTYGYVLADGDLGDAFTVDILDPETNSGPVFRLRAGKSACPYEGAQESNYYKKGTVYKQATQRREVAVLEVASASIVDNIPSHQEAVFTLNMGNASDTDDSSWYALRVVEESNPNGALLKLNGGIITTPVEVAAGDKLQVQLSLQKNIKYDEYEDIKIMMYSTCEFENYQNDGELLVADTVSLSAFFIPSCGDLEISKPKNNWVINKSDNNEKEVIISGLQSIDENFKSIIIQYRPLEANTWINIQKYVSKTELLEEGVLLIDANTNTIKYTWNTEQVNEGIYELRILSTCNSDVTNTTIPVKGIIDRISPSIFGSISPKDGVLNTGELIRINFTEDIRTELLSKQNISISGILNRSEIDNSVASYFDGNNNNILIRTNGQEFHSSFTIEFWAKRNAQGKQILFAQSSGSSKSFEIGFNEENNFFVNSNNELLLVEAKVEKDEWLHWAVSYNESTKLLNVYKNDIDVARKTMDSDIQRVGDIRLGKASEGEQFSFTGSMHHLRIWDTDLSRSAIVRNMRTRLSGLEINLYGLWRLNEGKGNICLDMVRNNNAIFNADWEFNPKGKSGIFKGNEYLEVKAGDFAFNEDDSYSISFWFYTNNNSSQSLFSLGDGEFNNQELNIALNTEGNILINTKGKQHIIDNTKLNDENWHHFSMSVTKPGSTNFLIDGVLIKSIASKEIGGLAGEAYYLGAKSSYNKTGQLTISDFYNGQIDEFRIWSHARNNKIVKRDMYYKLDENTQGLESYIAFEEYTIEMNVPKLTDNYRELSHNKANTINNGVEYSDNIPAVKLPRQVENVNFDILKSERSIVITINEDSKRIEKTNIDIKIFDILDIQNNKMNNPISYTVKIDQNQLRWKNTSIQKEFKENLENEITNEIVNTGVKTQNFAITNIPNWIEVIPQAGTIEGGQSINIKMIVHPGLNVGKYNQQVYLTGDTEFNEALVLDINIQAIKPEWSKQLSNFQYNMNIIGRLVIDEIPSTDSNDMIAAYVGNELRGFANVNYQNRFDNYTVFLSVGSNTTENEKITFKIWDASTGLIYPVDNKNFVFENDAIKGSVQKPLIFESGSIVQRNIYIKEGWNWLSVNLRNTSDDINTIFSGINASDDDRLVGQKSFYTYTDGQWEGSRTKVNFTSMYKLYAQQEATLRISGIPIDPITTVIDIAEGWNWISYTPQYNAEINEALSLYSAEDNAEIKTMDKFARYDENTKKWYGSLTHLKPGEGYQINSNKSEKLIFPQNSSFTSLKSATVGNVYESNIDEKNAYSTLFVNSKSNMTVVARLVDQYGNSIESENITALNENIKLSTTNTITENNRNLYFITIPKDDNISEVNFKYKNSNNKYENITNTINYNENSYMGSVEYPIDLIANVFTSENTVKTYPNPVSNILNIDINIIEKSDVLIDIYSTNGTKLISTSRKQLTKGKHIIKLEDNISNLKTGTYIF